MSNGFDELHIFGVEPAHDYMADVYDRSTGRFVRFEPHALSEMLQGKGLTTAIVDTGLLTKHPDIRARLVDAVDFTGEGLEDEHGHGTIVALLFLVGMPQATLVSVKVLGRQARSDPSRLLEAFRWLKRNERVRLINLSGGVTRPNCAGDCDICEGARNLVRHGKEMAVAAGNIPGITACPAKASDAVVTVTALDENGRLARYASPATKFGFAERVPTVRTSWVDDSGAVIS